MSTDFHRRFFMAVALLSWLVPMPLRGETIKLGGTGAALGTMKVLAEAFQKSHPGVEPQIVGGLGSGGAKKAVLQGAIDVAITSKAGKAPENVPGAMTTEYGRTPFVFATSKSNPTEGVTMQQILSVYSGKMIAWPDGRRLRLIIRPETDSDTELLKGISSAMAEAVKNAQSREGLKMALTDQDSADAIESIPGALGTSTLALMLSEKRSLKALSLDQVIPSARTIADGAYAHFKSFYMVTKPKPSETAEKFIAFVLSPEGNRILTRLGHWGVKADVGQ